MKTLLAVAALMFATTAFAQDAVVVELSKTDADQAKQLYEAKQAADKAWDEAYKHIVGQHKEFELSGADFSKDFRFIVPKSALTSAIPIGGGLYVASPSPPCSPLLNNWNSTSATPIPYDFIPDQHMGTSTWSITSQ